MPRIDHPIRLAESKQALRLKAAIVKTRNDAFVRLEHVHVAGKAAAREQGRIQPLRRGIAAMRAFGHGADVGEQRAHARTGDAHGMP